MLGQESGLGPHLINKSKDRRRWAFEAYICGGLLLRSQYAVGDAGINRFHPIHISERNR